MATTTNYGWTTPDDTDLVKDGAAAIRTLGSSVDTTTKALNPSTTEGDIEYRSATANTNSRLAIGTAGQVLTVNSGEDAPEWSTLTIPTPGLTLITRQTYTTSGAVNVNDVFSATYENYFIICKNSAASAPSNLNLRLRVAGADNTTSNYSTGAAESNNGGLTNRYNTAQSSFFAATFDQSSIWSMTATIVNPFIANTTSFHFSNLADSGGFRTGTGAGNFNASTSFTGFSLLPQASATITGVVAVYGYKI